MREQKSCIHTGVNSSFFFFFFCVCVCVCVCVVCGIEVADGNTVDAGMFSFNFRVVSLSKHKYAIDINKQFSRRV